MQQNRANIIQQLTGPTSGIVALVLAGLLFAAVGVSGVMIIDLPAMVVILAKSRPILTKIEPFSHIG